MHPEIPIANVAEVTRRAFNRPVYAEHDTCDNCFVLYFDGRPLDGRPPDSGIVVASGTYPFHEERCATPDAFFRWCWHLSEKSWFTNQHLRDFTAAVAKRWGWSVGPV